MIELLIVPLVVVGVFFMTVAAVGVVRLPDFFLRIHAPTKAATLGLFCLASVAVLAFGDVVTAAKAILIVAFLSVTAPIGGHVLFRAATKRGMKP